MCYVLCVLYAVVILAHVLQLTRCSPGSLQENIIGDCYTKSEWTITFLGCSNSPLAHE